MRLLGRFKERLKEGVQDKQDGGLPLVLFLAGAAGQERTDKARAGHGLEQVRSSAKQGKAVWSGQPRKERPACYGISVIV